MLFRMSYFLRWPTFGAEPKQPWPSVFPGDDQPSNPVRECVQVFP